MTSKLYNLARMTSATTGTGTITLGSAVSGYLTFDLAGVANSDVVDYAIKDGTNSESGTGTYTTSGTTLTRSVTKSTNSNSAISLSGSAEVFISPRAETLADAGLLTTGSLADARLSNTITAGGPTGSSTSVPVITYDAHGRLTAVTTATITAVTPPTTTNTQTANYTLVLADAGKEVFMNKVAGGNVTIPLNASVAFPVGTCIFITANADGSANTTNVVATGGVTLRGSKTLGASSAGTNLPLACTLMKIATDTWIAV